MVEFWKAVMSIFLVSALLLFSELVVIRWIGTEVNVFAYLQNVLLICCFMGFGVGLCGEKRSKPLAEFITPMLLLLGLTSLPVLRETLGNISVAISALGQSYVAWNIFHNQDFELSYVPVVALGLLLTFFIMLLVSMAFIPLGSWLSECFSRSSSTLKTYAINLLGSLAGIWAFYCASALTLPPFVWFLLISLFAVVCAWRMEEAPSRSIVALTLLLPIVAVYSQYSEDAKLSVWSPYQKLVVRDIHSPPFDMEGQWILVNNSGYQMMLDLRPQSLLARPDLYRQSWEGYTQYDLPLRLNPKATTALFLGAGSGNDPAAAVRARVPEITAVDIDPVTIEFGRRYHPEQPYANSTVLPKIADARAFLAETDQSFDVISFGLLDSHTSGQMTNARLDHFVYTKEAIEQAARHLTRSGVMTLAFEASKPYIADRIRSVLREIFKQEPIVLKIPKSAYGFGGVMFITGDLESVRRAIDRDPRLKNIVETLRYQVPELKTPITTDDWPYIYLEKPSIPPLFFVVPILALGVFLLLTKLLNTPIVWRDFTPADIYFMFLGAGFLLLEVCSISRAALILGTAWQPTAAIITGIMLMAMASNAVALRWNPSLVFSVIGVIASCAFIYFFDFSSLLVFPAQTRFFAVAIISCLPTFFSGLLFSQAFAHSNNPSRSLAMNALGSVVGAVFQNMSLLFGLKFLLIIVGLFYLGAAICLLKMEIRPKVKVNA